MASSVEVVGGFEDGQELVDLERATGLPSLWDLPDAPSAG
jgi:hypothetical protein